MSRGSGLKVLQLQKPCCTMSMHEYGLFSIHVDLELSNNVAWFKHDDDWLLIENYLKWSNRKSKKKRKNKNLTYDRNECVCVLQDGGTPSDRWLVPIPVFINIIFIPLKQISLFSEPSRSCTILTNILFSLRGHWTFSIEVSSFPPPSNSKDFIIMYIQTSNSKWIDNNRLTM